MRILGVDPGLRITGYGVIKIADAAQGGKRLDLLEAGVIRTRTGDPIAERLKKIFSGLSEAIEEFKPEVLLIEKLYAHYKHPTTAILMGHVRGVVCLLAGVYGIPLKSIAATHAKKAVTGRGHAPKSQVQQMVQHTLGLKTALEPPDVADALALAITYASTVKQ